MYMISDGILCRTYCEQIHRQQTASLGRNRSEKMPGVLALSDPQTTVLKAWDDLNSAPSWLAPSKMPIVCFSSVYSPLSKTVDPFAAGRSEKYVCSRYVLVQVHDRPTSHFGCKAVARSSFVPTCSLGMRLSRYAPARMLASVLAERLLRPDRMDPESLPDSLFLNRGGGAKSRAVNVVDLRRACLIQSSVVGNGRATSWGNSRARHLSQVLEWRSEWRVRTSRG